MFRFLGHFLTITKHRHEVVRLCFRAGIGFQGLFHDLSKYSPTEFIPGVRFYTGKESPNNGERRSCGYSLAWMHHKGRNKHHFEYWYDYDMVTKKIVPVDMPDRYIKEMCCDRIAASKVYNKENYTTKSPLNYLQKSTAREKMTETTYRKLLYLLTMLAEKGEKETLKRMRQMREIPEAEANSASNIERNVSCE
ncbi:DUF5662 family protein [Fibrobacter intestinalis]|uniref:Catalase n=1 Tax=Fibrobacter intestinalis TaxID=28122 RepID=A0A1T4QKB2_9BACT|nr:MULTISPECIES: DUF5662 family protein [Fibrobacter]PBC75229.1 hypothetical protein BGW94_2915 [Fibrobacter sp. NR9]SKA04152.1 hypothetical protein SAMN02745108_02320 [Fibrobacter intestinalis]